MLILWMKWMSMVMRMVERGTDGPYAPVVCDRSSSGGRTRFDSSWSRVSPGVACRELRRDSPVAGAWQQCFPKRQESYLWGCCRDCCGCGCG